MQLSKKILLLVSAVLLTSLGYLYYILNKTDLLSIGKLRAALLVVALFTVALTALLYRTKKYQRWLIALLIVVLLIDGYVLYKVNATLRFFDTVNQSAQQSVNMVKFVALDGAAETFEDLAGKPVYGLAFDRADIEQALIQQGRTVEVTYLSSQEELYQCLIAGGEGTVILTSKSEALFESVYEDVLTNLKTIDQQPVSQAVELPTPKVEKVESFNVYISGIDSYGELETVSRSDVNIVMTVNLAKGKIMLTSMPRDAYVRIADGGNNQYDKLTHAGLYGVGASLHTLENLYGNKIDFFVRVNFTSFLEVIDVIGGVDVYNDQEFVSLHGGDYFPVGNVHMTAREALGYVRERYALKHGDFDRNRNQEKVIKAVIEKLMQKENLLNSERILHAVAKSLQTNVSFDQVMHWVDYLLATRNQLEVESVIVEGRGRSGLSSYLMPGYKLYMFELDKDNLAMISQKMSEVLAEED